ncbi:MAG: protease PrsW [Thermoplasmatota archaeon]
MESIVLPQASLFLGVIPALILLYLSLKDYEGMYKDKTIFLTFVVGIVLGFIAAFVQSLTFFSLISIVLICSFDQLLKTIILNIGRFQKKIETPIYGLCLGLGFGSSFTPFYIIAFSRLIPTQASILFLVGIGSFGLILFHGATGAYVGYGIYVGKLFKYLIKAIVFQLPLNFLVGLLIITSDPADIPVTTILVFSIIAYGAVIFWYVSTKIIPQILPKNIRRRKGKGKPLSKTQD